MSIWSTFGDMGAGILGGLASSGIEYGFSRAAAEDQMDMARRLAKKYPSWQAEGLERAGLNRILAVRPGGASPPAPGMMPTPQVGANIARTTAATAVKSQIAQTEATTALTNQQRRLAQLDAALKARAITMQDFEVIQKAMQTAWFADPSHVSALKGRHAGGDSFWGNANALISRILDWLDGLAAPPPDEGEDPTDQMMRDWMRFNEIRGGRMAK